MHAAFADARRQSTHAATIYRASEIACNTLPCGFTPLGLPTPLLPVLPFGSPLERYLPDPEPSDETGLTPADIVRRTRQQRAAVAGTLVAGLEMAKQGLLQIEQTAPFETVVLSLVDG